jgi:hypothetical protein
MKNGVITDKYGAQRWYVNGQLHRTHCYSVNKTTLTKNN